MWHDVEAEIDLLNFWMVASGGKDMVPNSRDGKFMVPAAFLPRKFCGYLYSGAFAHGGS